MKKATKYGLYVGILLWVIAATVAFSTGIFSMKWSEHKSNITKTVLNTKNLQEAYFAGGCFWCMEAVFEQQAWVEWAYAWYTGWSEETATYELTSNKDTGHREAVKVLYDPNQITYRKLVELYWTQIDPTDDEGQFNDRWFVYSPAIFYNDVNEKIAAQASKNDLSVSKRFSDSIVVAIEPAKEFFLAEDYHQDYYKNNSIRYKVYTSGSGRKSFIEENWQDRIEELKWKDYVNWQLVEQKSPSLDSLSSIKIQSQYSEQELRERLTPLQYKVTQEEGTEPAFNNEYWDNKEPGIYVDIVDGTPLYSSLDKFDSWTGWPSFTKWIDESLLTTHTDTRFFMTRTEVRSAKTDSHLGHIFNDAPKDLWGIRHCINSASLRFVPVEDLEKEGHEEYLELFE